jgi:hypothetical protein
MEEGEEGRPVYRDQPYIPGSGSIRTPGSYRPPDGLHIYFRPIKTATSRA